MKTLLIVFASLILSVICSFTSINKNTKVDDCITFYTGTWQQAIDLAKKENKMIFLDAYASWCGPCTKMKRITFTDKSVAEYFNKNFINLAIDMEKGNGPSLARRFSVEAYPTLIFIKTDGSVLSKSVGFHKASQFLELGKKANKSK